MPNPNVSGRDSVPQTGTSTGHITAAGAIPVFQRETVIDASLGALAVTLPDAMDAIGAMFHVHLPSIGVSTPSVITLSGVGLATNIVLDKSGDSVVVWSNGTNYKTITTISYPGRPTGLQKITQVCPVADFTDVDATGFLDLDDVIPAGALFVGATVTAIIGFAGDTTAIMDFGDGADVDRFNAAAVNVFATSATGGQAGVPGGDLFLQTAATVRLTITGGSDFSDIVTNGDGSVTVELYYLI